MLQKAEKKKRARAGLTAQAFSEMLMPHAERNQHFLEYNECARVQDSVTDQKAMTDAVGLLRDIRYVKSPNKRLVLEALGLIEKKHKAKLVLTETPMVWSDPRPIA